MQTPKEIFTEIDHLLQKLSGSPKVDSSSASHICQVGFKVCYAILRLLGCDDFKPTEDVIETYSKLPNVERYNSWFQDHPIFIEKKSCFNIFENDIFEAKLYFLKNKRKDYVLGASNFIANFGDREYTKTDQYKIGINFFLAPDGKSLQVSLNSNDCLRVVELSQKLNNTQKQIFESWSKFKPIKTKEEIHSYLWDSFQIKSVNQDFYKGISSHFNEMVGHLVETGKSQRDAKIFTNRLLGRLLFCWFLREKNIIDKSIDYFESVRSFDATQYYRKFLEKLFFKTLNTPRDQRESQLGQTDRTTPYLNGSLFSQYETDWVDDDLTFPDGFFGRLYDHFNQFNFTTDESSTDYEQVAIDPEMLGRIFENLLAEQIDETGQQARKAKGSYYTPREVVTYMCAESLRHYLYEYFAGNDLIKKSIDGLIDTSEAEWVKSKSNMHRDQVKQHRDKLRDALDEVTIFDPACGSGAFLIGMMYLMTRCYKRLEPRFKPYDVKKYIIRNNLFGADIDPVAVEISRLRAWLSLVVDEADPEPLPNLEFKFVCADTLKKLKKDEARIGLFYDEDHINKLKSIQKKWFEASDFNSKSELKAEYERLVEENPNHEHDDTMKQIKSFAPFTNSRPAEFFDIEHMFAIKDGFDIMIGNPPYIQLQKNSGRLSRKYEPQRFETFAKTGDIYQLFYERGMHLLKNNGLLCYITSDKWMRTEYGKKTRRLFSTKYSVLKLIALGPNIFEHATVDTNILLLKKSNSHREMAKACTVFSGGFSKERIAKNSHKFSADPEGKSWLILSPIEKCIKDKIERIGKPLKEWDIDIYYGIKTGYNKAFVIDNETKNRLVAEDNRSVEILKPVLRGKDIKRYKADWQGLWLINSHNGYGDINPVDINEYPLIKKHLDQYRERITRRQDRGITPYNLRNCAYQGEFYKEKVIYPGISENFYAYYDNSRYLMNNSCFLMVGKDIKFITSFLNTRINNFYYKRYMGVQFNKVGYKMQKSIVEKIPIPCPNQKIRDLCEDIINKAMQGEPDDSAISLLERTLCELYNFSSDETMMIMSDNHA